MILEQYLGQDAGPDGVNYVPGDTLTLTDPRTGKAAQKTFAGIIQSAFSLSGGGRGPLREPDHPGRRGHPGPVRAGRQGLGCAPQARLGRLRADPGRRPAGQFLPQSLVATRVRASVEQNLTGTRSFFRLMQGFLALGLLVGIAGLGVVMIRAVRERRRNIGVLRALGF